MKIFTIFEDGPYFSEYCEDFTSFVDTSSTLVTCHLYERLQLVEVVVEDGLVHGHQSEVTTEVT